MYLGFSGCGTLPQWWHITPVETNIMEKISTNYFFFCSRKNPYPENKGLDEIMKRNKMYIFTTKDEFVKKLDRELPTLCGKYGWRETKCCDGEKTFKRDVLSNPQCKSKKIEPDPNCETPCSGPAPKPEPVTSTSTTKIITTSTPRPPPPSTTTSTVKISPTKRKSTTTTSHDQTFPKPDEEVTTIATKEMTTGGSGEAGNKSDDSTLYMIIGIACGALVLLLLIVLILIIVFQRQKRKRSKVIVIDRKKGHQRRESRDSSSYTKTDHTKHHTKHEKSHKIHVTHGKTKSGGSADTKHHKKADVGGRKGLELDKKNKDKEKGLKVDLRTPAGSRKRKH